MELGIFVLATFFVSAFFGWLTIPHIVLISKKKKLFDEISDRKSHTGSVPRLGGTSFFPSFLISLSLMLGFRYFYGYEITSYVELSVFTELTFIIAGSTILFFVGLADDLTGLSYKTKLVAQVISAILLIYAGVGIENMDGILGIGGINPIVGALFTVILVVLITNAYNLIDGIDGLCSGLAVIALFTLGWWYLKVNLIFYAMMAMAMAGVVLTFFFYNTMGKRLKVFMGDTGSLALGYMIAFLGLKFYCLNTLTVDNYNVDSAAAIFLSIVFMPVFDAVRVFCVRMAQGLSPFYPDKRHIHHKMLHLGFTHFQSMLIIVALQVLIIAINVSLRKLDVTLLLFIDICFGLLLNLTLNQFINRRISKRVKE